MLTHYVEVRAIPQIEITQTEVMNQLIQTLHRLLGRYQGKVGISFPAYKVRQYRSLGGIIRLFGSLSSLTDLASDLQVKMGDYALVMAIHPIPEKVKGHLLVGRARQKGQSALRRAEKRLTEQGKWTEQVRNNMIEKWGGVELSYPHFKLKSASTEQDFILWVKQVAVDSACDGDFNSYGMSQRATVPDF